MPSLSVIRYRLVTLTGKKATHCGCIVSSSRSYKPSEKKNCQMLFTEQLNLRNNMAKKRGGHYECGSYVKLRIMHKREYNKKKIRFL